MFIGQLLKILFIAAFFYLIYNLVAYIIRIRRIIKAKRREEEIKGGNTRGDASEQNGRKKVIEIDKDHYKVE
jgi:hypothetical protein